MDSPLEIQKDNPTTKILIEIDLANGLASNSKIFLDTYDNQADRINKTNGINRLESFEERIIKEAIQQLVQQLLLETIYIATLARYYQSLYYFQPGFGASSYSGQYSQNYFSSSPQNYSAPYPRYYPEQYPQNYASPYPQNYPEQYPQYYFGPDLSQPRSKNFAPANRLAPYPAVKATNRSIRPSTLSVKTRPHSSLARNIISIAEHNLGRPVWAFSEFASLCQRGYLGCAVTVSELLQDAGLRIRGSASVYGLVNELGNLGWHKIKIYDKRQFHAGDIVYGLNGRHAHIGIITAADKDKILVCDNSSSSGTLKERTIENGGSFTPNGRFAGSLYVMRQS